MHRPTPQDESAQNEARRSGANTATGNRKEKETFEMSIPRPSLHVNGPVKLDDLFDGDKRAVNNAAERLALTVAEMVQAAENRYGMEYHRQAVRQGGVGWVEVVMPADDPQAAPWVHLLPAGKREVSVVGPDGHRVTVDMPVYLVRAAAPHYGAPDWSESLLMHEHLEDAAAVEWLTDYRAWVAEGNLGDPENLLEEMS
jgi:hypothetical protein